MLVVLANFKKLENSYFHASNSRQITTHGNLPTDLVQWHSRREVKQKKTRNRKRYRNGIGLDETQFIDSLSTGSSNFFCLC